MLIVEPLTVPEPDTILRPDVLTAVPEVVVLLLSMIVSLLIVDLETLPEVAPETEVDLLEVPVTGIVPDCREPTDD